MIFTVANFKGGVGKTTTAIHLAAYLQTLDSTILFDGDKTRNAIGWSQRSKGLPFPVAAENQAVKLAANFVHKVVDTGKQPTIAELKDAAEGSDLMIIPAKAASMDTDSLIQTLNALQEVGCTNYKVLLTVVASHHAKKAAKLREGLASVGAPVFEAEIPRFEVFDMAAAMGCTVDQIGGEYSARAWAAYMAVGKELGL